MVGLGFLGSLNLAALSLVGPREFCSAADDPAGDHVDNHGDRKQDQPGRNQKVRVIAASLWKLKSDVGGDRV